MFIQNVSVAGGFCSLVHELVSEFIAEHDQIRNKPPCEIVSLYLLKIFNFRNDSCVSVKSAVNSNHGSTRFDTCRFMYFCWKYRLHCLWNPISDPFLSHV